MLNWLKTKTEQKLSLKNGNQITLVALTAFFLVTCRIQDKVLSDKYEHEPKKFNLLDNPEHLKWLHTTISNAKRFIKGTFHGLGTKHITAYLAEYSYRFNRRHFGNELFNRLLNSCVNTKVTTYAELV